MIKIKHNLDDITKILEKEVKKYKKEIELEERKMSKNISFEVLSPLAEEILKIILDNQDGYPKVLRQILKKEIPLSIQCSNDRILSCIKKLEETGMISNIKWSDNLPYYGRIEEDGYNYFENKSKQSEEQKVQKTYNYNFGNSQFTNSIVSIGDNNENTNINEITDKLVELINEIESNKYNLKEDDKQEMLSYIEHAKVESEKGNKKVALRFIKNIWDFAKEVGAQVLATYIAYQFNLS